MDIFASLRQTWSALTAGQRVGTILVVLVSAGVLAGISYFGNRVEYRALAVGDPTKIGEIASSLESAGIKPRVQGNSIQVPVDRFDEAVLSIAKQGLNTDGVGFELLDKGTNAFTTSLLERVNVQRAVAGELERILRGYPGIATARVLISQDQEGWRKQEKDGTASVSVMLRPGNSLSANDVAAIQSCVANAWHTLKPENVSVNANGKKLTRDVNTDMDKQFSAANHQLAAQLEYEDALQKRAQLALDRAQGPSKTIVTVVAELDFDSKTEKSYVVDPEKIVPKTETIHEASKGNANASSSGVTGITGNTPADSPGVAAAGADSKDIDKTTTVDNAISYNDRVTEKRGFSVKRLSISLFVDQSLKKRLPELEKAVKAAVGFDDKREDQFSATAESEFQKPDEESAPVQPVSSSNIPELMSTGGRVGALVALAILFLFLIKRANRSAKMATAGSRPGVQYTSDQGVTQGRAGAMGTADIAAGSDRPPEEIARASVAKNAATAATSDPAAAGRVVRTWLEEKRPR
ncbi:MAG: flagellar basal-body MS-ring/collar protein FliF [Planctomycetota bacterium]